MLTSSHRKVLACVICGRLKSAFQIASRSGSVADVQYVAHQALHANALPVLDMCKQWLAQYIAFRKNRAIMLIRVKKACDGQPFYWEACHG
ncbi:hypothetical protein NL676_035401 [Syzygium grande]|nr:hypothetical protein NL676_035401 [Syzygium grande]